MTGSWGTETEFELTTLERLRALGYTHAIGAEIAEKHREADSEVVFRKILREHLTKRYSHLPAESIDEAVRLFARPDGVDTLRRNMAFHVRIPAIVIAQSGHRDRRFWGKLITRRSEATRWSAHEGLSSH